MQILPSFPIAIKYPSSKDLQNVDLLLEEAKTMLRIGSYHDYIVNLQGIIYNNDGGGNKILEVSVKMMVIPKHSSKNEYKKEKKYSYHFFIFYSEKGGTFTGILFKRRCEIIFNQVPTRF